MSQSSKNEGRRRSRAITAIINAIGRDFWNRLSTNEGSKRIKVQIVKTKKITQKGRDFIKNLNKHYKGRYPEPIAA